MSTDRPDRSGATLVTGASAGIGAALAREFARHGHDLVLVARREDRLESLAGELERHGVGVDVVAMDLAEGGALDRLWAELDDRGVALDTLVNNVGIGTYGPFAESDREAERTQLRLNVEVLVDLTHRFLEGRETGSVLNVGSVAGFVPGAYMAGYYASKAYVNSFSQALAAEYHDSAVDVTVLCPGPTETEFQERAGMGESAVGRYLFYTAEEVARAGYHGLQRGEAVVIPGLGMRALVALLPFVPRSLQRWGSRLVNGDR